MLEREGRLTRLALAQWSKIKFLNKSRPPLMEQNPLLFWKSMSFILLTIIIYLLSTHPGIN